MTVATLPHLRRMTSQDLDAVYAIEQQAYPYPWSRGIFQDCLKAGYLCYVFCDPQQQQRVYAYFILSVAIGESHLLNLCVQPEYQQQGLGTLLLEQIERMAKKRLADCCFLEVRISNIKAIKLYLHHDFKRMALRKAYYPTDTGREDALLMKKAFSEE